MGCLFTRFARPVPAPDIPRPKPVTAPMAAEQYPKYDKVWRSFDYRIGYKCTRCGEPAKCFDYVSLRCTPDEYFVSENQWHRHCKHRVFVEVLCCLGHTTRQILNSGCECGWRNQDEFSETDGAESPLLEGRDPVV